MCAVSNAPRALAWYDNEEPMGLELSNTLRKAPPKEVQFHLEAKA
jgi:hypothetical protein